ncbi:MAG: hypothetical protein DCC57_13960 [Chloroflexi bacterium]|nr:MAG: hypothetical protein DCC57_13960 [Chloroflexota bacterium]
MMEQEIRKAARRLIAQMARLAAEDEPASEPSNSVVEYQSLLAQLALAQVALVYPQASLGTCIEHGAPLHFRARADGLYVCCTGSGGEHGWKIA